MKKAVQTMSLSASAALLALSMRAGSVFAQGFAGPPPDVAGLPAGASAGDIRQVISNVLTTVLNFLALIAVVVVVIAGIRLILSQGEEEAKEKAKKTIFYALIGLVVVLFSRVIVGLVTVYLFQTVSNPNA